MAKRMRKLHNVRSTRLGTDDYNMNRDVINWAWQQALKPTEKIVLIALATKTKQLRDHVLAECTIPEIAAMCDISASKTRKTLKHFQRMNLVQSVQLRHKMDKEIYYKLLMDK